MMLTPFKMKRHSNKFKTINLEHYLSFGRLNQSANKFFVAEESFWENFQKASNMSTFPT